MNMKAETRWLCILLCLAMVLGLVPSTALATTEEENTSPVAQAAATSVDYYGRNALSALSNSTALLYAYDQLAAGIADSAESITIYNGTDPITKKEFQTVLDAYTRDYAHHFWLGNSYQISLNSTTVVRFLPSYTVTGSELEAAKTALEQKVTDILSGITDTMSEYEKVLYLHDTLAGIIAYEAGTNAHNAYGALIEGKAVCEGYAEALQYLLQRAGVQAFLAVGASINPATNTADGHEWNYVRIDGSYYHVDLTWDDQGEDLFHNYFNQTDAVMQEDHAFSTTEYALPVCDSTAAQYFTGKDEYLSSYTVDTVGQLLKNNSMTVQVYIPGSVSGFLSWYQSNIVAIGKTAGITGGFSYSYSRLGREVILRLRTVCTHTSLTLQPAAAATETTSGHIPYYLCSCGKYFADASAYQQISDLAAWKAGDGRLAYGQQITGSCGTGLTWTLVNTTLTISGTGAMTDFTAQAAPWYGYAGIIQLVCAESGVTTVGNYAFYGFTTLTTFAAPVSLTNIAQYAFDGCDNLQAVYYSGSQTQAQQISGTAASATWYYHAVLAEDDLAAVLQSAEAGTRVVLTQSLSLSNIDIGADITLDLNGYTLATNYFTCYGNVTDGAAGGEGLISASDSIYIAGKESYLPIYDSAASGYRFYKYALQNLGYKTVAENSNAVMVGIRLTLENAAGYDVLATTADSSLVISAQISLSSWDVGIQYSFKESTLRSYASQLSADIAANGSSSTAIILTICGLDSMGENTTLSVQPIVETAPGPTAQGDSVTWSAL